MKIVVIYRPNSEHGRSTEEFAHEFSRRYADYKLEMLNIDGREGSAAANLYDITSYPAVLVLRDDGSTSNIWQGEQLPLLDDVASYVVH